MKTIHKSTFYLLVVLLLSSSISSAQDDELWSDETPTNLLLFQKSGKQLLQKKERICRLNLSLLKQKLKESHSNIQNKSLKQTKLTIPFPNKNGGLTNYIVSEAPTFSPELQAKFPTIRSYIGVSDDSLKTVVRFSMSDLGLNLMKFSKDGNSEFIDPYTKDALTYAIYSKNDLPTDIPKNICNVIDEETVLFKSTKAAKTVANDGKLRTFRLALSCTGEYAEFQLNDQNIDASASDEVKKAAVLAAMNVSMTRINGIFERDLALRMQLIPNNDALIFLNSNTDGYTSDDDSKMIDEVQAKCDAIIGTANYDIGHLFSTGFSGLAELSSPCKFSTKASAVSGRTPANGDSFDIDFVAHEMGHQFGATHTFNNSCDKNISNNTSVEPGSGTTIMGYAGICSPDIQEHSDDYFHGVSIEQMYNNITFGNSTCAEESNIGNTPPTADAGSNYTIPISTPFVLTGIGTDDGEQLTYCWEQTDTQESAMPPLATSSAGPIFRSLPPSSSEERHFPNLETTLSGQIANTWEKLPSVSRNINYKLTVRDNGTPTGQFATDNTKITVSELAGPFKITSQNTAETFYVGESKTITWNVAGTDAAPINTNFVNILLSTDGGLTYPISLAENAINNGSHSILVPNQTTTSARIKIEAVDNIYYSINTENITILASSFTMTFEENKIATCAPNDALYTFEYNTYQDFNEETTFSVSNLPEGISAVFSPESATADGTTVTLRLTNISEIHNGIYQPLITGTSTSETNNVASSLTIDTSIETTPYLTSPANNANSLSTAITFSWEAETEINFYILEIASDIEFLNIVETTTTEFRNYTAKNLATDSTYYWRVRETNSCDTGDNSTIYKFQTGILEDFNFTNNQRTTIPDNNSSGINSIINISDIIEISEVKITLNITHSYIGDLKITLKNPAGEEITLVQNSDQNGSNYTGTTFDDAATLTLLQGAAPYNGTYKPKDAFSVYNATKSQGDWTLNISDNEADDEGSLLNWKITINGIDQNALSSGDLPNDTAPKISKAFTPNGDLTNDYWTIENINTTNFDNSNYPSANVKIFNIQGQLIYAANPYRNDWDGTDNNGSKLPIGTYIFEVNFSDPKFNSQKGWIYIKY